MVAAACLPPTQILLTFPNYQMPENPILIEIVFLQKIKPFKHWIIQEQFVLLIIFSQIYKGYNYKFKGIDISQKGSIIFQFLEDSVNRGYVSVTHCDM